MKNSVNSKPHAAAPPMFIIVTIIVKATLAMIPTSLLSSARVDATKIMTKCINIVVKIIINISAVTNQQITLNIHALWKESVRH
jgi:ABC-type sugar transport system permease subunit